MKVYVAIVREITPDVLIDHGGGEIGIEDVLGVASTREEATLLTREHVDNRLLMYEMDGDDPYSGFDDELNYYYHYYVQECELITSKLIHTPEGELIINVETNG